MLAWCMVEDQQWKENDRKVKIGGHRKVSNEEAHQWTTLVGGGGALVSLTVSSLCLWSAVLLCRSPMLIARMASANSL